MALRFPKSVSESQRFVGWAFPALLTYGVMSLPLTVNWVGGTALVLSTMVVITGWQSFGVIEERIYNDVLLITDIGLLATYWLLMYYSWHLKDELTDIDTVIFTLSGTTFILYSIWDITALGGRDTTALATAAHLKRFAVATLIIALIFFGMGALSTVAMGKEYSALLRGLCLGIWLLVIVWWQASRFVAAVRDANA